MTQNNTSSKPVCESCGLRHFERNQYFDGKLLVTRDFEDEQSYLRGKDRLHSSMLHGEGAVCGLKLTEHPNPAQISDEVGSILWNLRGSSRHAAPPAPSPVRRR